MYAVVTVVNIDPAQRENAQGTLKDRIVPMVKQAPGLVAGRWVEDPAHGKGYAMVVFDTEQNARAQLARIEQMSPESPAPGVKWEVKFVGEVIAEANP